MNTFLGNMLGRAELAPGYNAVMVSSDGTASPAMVGGAMFTGSGNVSAGADVAVGQLSAGLLAGGVIALILFYAWTRGTQK